MTLRIRQLALVARELETTVEQLCATLGVDVCYRDPGVAQFGLHNALMAIGDTFLEVVSPVTAGTTAGRLLERRGGDGGYMVILQTDALNDDRKRFDALGIRVVWSIELDDIASVHLHPKDVGAAIVSFDQPIPASSWRWGGPDWTAHRRTDRTQVIVGAELQSEDPGALAARWSQVLARPSRPLATGAHVIDLDGASSADGGQLHFVRATDGRGDGLAGITIRRAPGADLHDTVLCGTCFRFID